MAPRDSHSGETPVNSSVADELKQECERLRQLADDLKAQEQVQAEMRANDPYLEQTVYAMLREKFARELPPLPDKDLEAIAADEGALPLEAFIDQVDKPAEARE